MEQNHELPSSFQETERRFYVGCGGCGRVAFRHTYSPNALFRAYFLFRQYPAKLLAVQLHGGETAWLLMCRNQSLNTWPLKRRRTPMRFPVASPKMALSTTRGRIILVVIRSASGSRRRTRSTDTCFRRLTFKPSETW